MPNVFIRHNGKVFGPFTPDRVDQLLKAGQFDAQAEFSYAWDGPWTPVEQWKATAVPAITPTPHGTAEAISRPPAPADAPAVATEAPEDGNPLGWGVGDETTDSFFQSIPPSATLNEPRSESSLRPRTVKQAVRPAAIVLAVLMLTGTVIAYRLLVPGTPATNKGVEVIIDDPFPSPSALPRTAQNQPDLKRTDTAASRAAQDPRTDQRPPSVPPETRTVRSSAASAATAKNRESTDDDRTGEANTRNGNGPILPAAAAEAINALRSVRASIDIGISFEKYSDKLQQLLPTVKLFLESHEAETVPELKSLLTNAVECYVRVKSIWNDSIYASGLEKQNASTLLLASRDDLWRAAEANAQIAYDFMSPDARKRSTATEEARRNAASLRMQPVLDAAILKIARQKIAATEAANQPPKPPSNAEGPPSSPPQTVNRAAQSFDRERIEVQEMRKLAESLLVEGLSKEEKEVVDDFLSLSRSREWVTRQGDRSWGDAITIGAKAVRLNTKKGDGPIARDRLSDAAQKVIDRLESLAVRLNEIDVKLAASGMVPPR